MMKVRSIRVMAGLVLSLALVAVVFTFGTNCVRAASATSRYYVYFPMYLQTGSYFLPVSFIVPPTQSLARSAMEALIQGLPDSAGLRLITLPENTKVRGISIDGGVCTVDFSGEIMSVSVGAGGEAVLIDSIVQTLCQFPTVDSVKILIEGNPAETLAGHVDISGPMKVRPHSTELFTTFEDAVHHWGGGAIAVLQAMDIVNGREGGSFKPDDHLTRAESLKMLVEAIAVPYAPDLEVPFSDVANHWSKPWIQRAIKAGLIASSDYGSYFKPDEVMPREEMAYLLLKAADAYELGHPYLEIPKADNIPHFGDSASIRERYRNAVLECARRGFIKGFPDGDFKPLNGLTRAEACAVLTRMMGIQGDNLLVVTPKPGYRWDGSNAFAIGAAAAFEATVNFRVKSGSGGLILESYTNSSYGMGWGLYGVSIHESLIDADEALLQVYLMSMEDGSDMSVVEVPLVRPTTE